MTQRATSYLSKPNTNWLQQINILSSTTFFLVGKSGPTVFNIRDEEGKIFKVTISNPHSCNCTTNSHGDSSLCIHMIFVLLKVLKLPQNHPLAYQASLTDSEITLVLSGSCGGTSTSTSARLISARRQNVNNTSNSSSSNSMMKTDQIDNDFVQRQILDEEDNLQCPICQDDMTKEQALTWCRRGCGELEMSVVVIVVIAVITIAVIITFITVIFIYCYYYFCYYCHYYCSYYYFVVIITVVTCTL